MAKAIRSQDYPRISDENHEFYGFLDESRLENHRGRLNSDELAEIIKDAIKYADSKSSMEFITRSKKSKENNLEKVYGKAGRELFNYFKKYCSDPAQTALDCYEKHYSLVAKEHARNLLVQKLRMHSGWRYQYIAKVGAIRSGRFMEVSDIGTSEADFNVTIRVRESQGLVYIYVSVKNRTNTMGGQDWPKAIHALETMANSDKNRNGPFICVFGIAIERGLRIIKAQKKTNSPYSFNTEIWMADFFWPFFTNFSYEEISRAVLDVLISGRKGRRPVINVPRKVIDTFGDLCIKYSLLDEKGRFNNPHKLVEFFCKPLLKGKALE